MQDIRPAKENLQSLLDAQTTGGRVVGDQTVPISTLKGGVSDSVADTERVRRLKDSIERLVVDQQGNVIEGAHRLAALRELGVSEVPVTVVKDPSLDFDLDAARGAVLATRKMRQESADRIVTGALEMLEESGSVEAALREFEIPAQLKEQFTAALTALADSRKPGPDSGLADTLTR